MNHNKLEAMKQSFSHNPSNHLARIMALTIVCLLLLFTGNTCAARQGGTSSITTRDESCRGWQIAQTQLEGVSLRFHVPTSGCQPNGGFVICHGMDGTVSEDRFDRLAQKLAQKYPDASGSSLDLCCKRHQQFRAGWPGMDVHQSPEKKNFV